MQQTITKLTFEQLPDDERTLIRSAIRAINTAAQNHSSAKDIEAKAFPRGNRALRAGGESYLYQSLVASAKKAGWSDGDVNVLRSNELQKRYDELFKEAAVEMREALVALVKKHGRIPEHGGAFGSLAATFNSDASTGWRAELSKDGYAQLSVRLRFKSALGLIAYVILRLSEISANEPALIICEECDKFKIVENTGGDRISRFCSALCRNRFTVREWRKANRTPRKSK